MERKKFNQSKYWFVLALTLVVYLFGILTGSAVTRDKVSELQHIEEELRLESIGLETRYDILEATACEEVADFNGDLDLLGTRVDFLESEFGIDDEDVIRLKEYYSLLEIKEWLLVKERASKCGEETSTILYFYTNEPKACDICQDQGYVLTYLRNKYDNLYIYSFEVSLQNPALDAIKGLYGVETVPTLIIDGEAYPSFQNSKQIMEKIGELPEKPRVQAGVV